MIKRFVPLEKPDNSRTIFSLPSSYIGGGITLFVNGQLLAVRDDLDNPFGYTIDDANKTFEFYNAPFEDDLIYIIFDDGSQHVLGLGDGNGLGKLSLKPGYNLISYPGVIKSKWDENLHRVIYPDNILANVQNMIIDQIEDVYETPAINIIRDIQTYRDDLKEYKTFIPGITGKAWTNNGEHIINKDLYRAPGTDDYGDPDNLNYVYYNPDNFILGNCILDTDEVTIISNDTENSIQDLPDGQRSGLHIYIKQDADLSKTNGVLEIKF